ncbi:MAG: UDP-N-acetylmuramoyl-L-alanyl-D-glutamate--2,6-diaminopimelate ligase [Gammaproteobacteria bacterium]|nr:UDP-N-acetylmuramoyl-L-alanyl-D-glutamate--2,6-diaminopimelate ligase [Gammaproteobacteria bacterium]
MMMPVIQPKHISMLLAGMLENSDVINDVRVVGISMNSRMVQKGGLFLSLSLKMEQRCIYLQQALDAGVMAVVFDKEQPLSDKELSLLAEAGVNVYRVSNLAANAGEIAARFYEHPSQAVTIIAITGTNGKTSVSQFIAQALESLGHACGIVGTLGVGRIDSLQATGMTTPDPVTLQALLAGFRQHDVDTVVIEASSHALDQGRLNSIAIDVAVFTNLSRDHLDYHQDMSEYASAKKQLFDFVSLKAAVINAADEFGQTLISSIASMGDVSLITYSSQPDDLTSLQAKDIQTRCDGLHFSVIGESGSACIQSSLLGRFNVDNLLAALASLMAVDISFDLAVSAIKRCHSVQGRMQSYGGDSRPHVVIDFAHTPDALAQALQSLRTHMSPQAHLWCVFGCGGDRDTGKRALMGQCAESNADVVVLTDDNPRSEDNDAIIRDILSGISEPEKVYIEHNRELAITYALDHAESVDIVLVAGKGHEQYQEISGVKYPFSDADAVIKVLDAANDDLHSVGAKQ